jgi:hypothetical protein
LNNAVVSVGLLVVAILVLIPVVMIVRLVWAIVHAYINDRRAESSKVTHYVSALGDFSSYDNRLWFGEVQGLQISIPTDGQPPNGSHTQQLRAILNDQSSLIEKAKKYLVAHDNASSFPGGAEAFQPYGIDFEDASAFVLEMVHPADQDGVYRVEFKDGDPVASGRDD